MASNSDSQFAQGHEIPVSDQKMPGLQSEMKGPPPQNDHIPTEDGGYQLYKAAGKLEGKKAVIVRTPSILFGVQDILLMWIADWR
ncbi:hypothetical protein LTR28_011222 [Elasticomyces elasticus]|nr:hypothetical protein LTR28_011222 [Elasticomyces elasticus]